VKQAGGVLSEVRFDHVDGNLTATYTATMPAAHVENMKVHAVLSQAMQTPQQHRAGVQGWNGPTGSAGMQGQRNARNSFLAALQRNHG
jgi:hypothetical protein